MPKQADRICNIVISWLGSAILHSAVILLALVAGDWELVSEETPLMKTEMLMLQAPEPPAPEPPAPEPPAPEPPAPESPAPESPAPEPPAPEPPAPEPPKPEPPKPVVLPKPEPPKPVVKPKPKPPKPRRLSIAERLRNAPVHRASRRPVSARRPVQRVERTTSSREWRRRLSDAGRIQNSSPSATDQVASRYSGRATMAEESVNYADTVVRPAYIEAWDMTRVSGDASPVWVELDVSSSGRVIHAWISRRSNDPHMNDSVEELIRRVRQFTDFSVVGIRSRSLHIRVILEVFDKQ